jgi:hypothetical protein
MTGHHLITPTHRSIRKYYENVAAFRAQMRPSLAAVLTNWGSPAIKVAEAPATTFMLSFVSRRIAH